MLPDRGVFDFSRMLNYCLNNKVITAEGVTSNVPLSAALVLKQKFSENIARPSLSLAAGYSFVRTVASLQGVNVMGEGYTKSAYEVTTESDTTDDDILACDASLSHEVTSSLLSIRCTLRARDCVIAVALKGPL